MIRAEDIGDLVSLGLTPSQARLYLIILRMGQTDGKSIAKRSGVARQEVYRIITELEEKGLIEKVIAKPYEFRGVQLQYGLSSLLAQKAAEYEFAKEKTSGLLKRFHPKEEEIFASYSIILIPKRDALIRRVINEFRISQQSVDVVTTVQRFMQATDFYKPISDAINRGVKIRLIMEKPGNEKSFPRDLKDLIEAGLEFKYLPKTPKAEAAIFDQKVALITLQQALYVKDSTCIWTNYPSLLANYQDHFNIIWRDSKLYKAEFGFCEEYEKKPPA